MELITMNDGLSDLDEKEAGTDPTDADSDDDGLDDGAENVAGTDPLSDDSDDDGLKDGAESATPTIPTHSMQTRTVTGWLTVRR